MKAEVRLFAQLLHTLRGRQMAEIQKMSSVLALGPTVQPLKNLPLNIAGAFNNLNKSPFWNSMISQLDLLY